MNKLLIWPLMVLFAGLLSSCTDVVEACFTIDESNCQSADSCFVTFDASCSKNNGDFIWNFGDGNVGEGRVVDHQYARPGEYEVTLTVDNALSGANYEIDSLTQVVNVSGNSFFQETFEEIYSDPDETEVLGLTPTSDGGYAIVGYTFDNGITMGFLRKLDGEGRLMWDKIIRKGNDRSRFYDVKETLDGGLILVGVGYDDDLPYGYAVKTEANGSILWEFDRVSDKPNIHYHSLTTVMENADGHYTAVGTIDGRYTYDNIWMISIGFDGDFRWESELSRADRGSSFKYSLQQTADRGYLVLCTGDPPSGANKNLIYKTTEMGEEVWNLELGNGEQPQFSGDILPTTDGNYLVAGYKRITGLNGQDGYLAKISPTGGILWEKTFGTQESDEIHAAAPTLNGGFILAGSTRLFEAGGYGPKQVYLVRVNSEGEVIWERTFGSERRSSAHDVAQTEDGAFVIGGYTSVDNDRQAYVIKTNTEGEVF